MNPSHIPPPATDAYWHCKDAAARRARQLRREAIEASWCKVAGVLQRPWSAWHVPWNWRKVRGSIG